MSTTPPRPLLALAEPGSALAHGLTAARLRGPSEEELRALERELTAVLGGAALLGVAAGAATAKSGGVAAAAAHAWLSTAAMKLTAVVVLAAAGTAGAVAWRRHALDRERTMAVAVRPESPLARALPVTAIVQAPSEPEAGALPTVPRQPPASTVRSFTERSASPRGASGLRSRQRQAAGSAVGARPRVTETRTGVDEPDLRDELSLIERAQHALSNDPSGALALVEEHERRYGDRLLAQEREVIAVVALSKLGRSIEVQARAERFIQRFPGSAHVARVRRLAVAAERKP